MKKLSELTDEIVNTNDYEELEELLSNVDSKYFIIRLFYKS